MIVGIACDHHGYEMKEQIKNGLSELKYDIIDYGTYTKNPVDYPDYAFKLGEGIINKECDLGIIMCMTGIGVSIASNKVKGIRCAKVTTEEEARLCRLHNCANEIAISTEQSLEQIMKLIETFLKTDFEKGRHQLRIDKITTYEEKKC